MIEPERNLFDDLEVDHVGWYVGDLEAQADRLSRELGLAAYGPCSPGRGGPPERTAAVGREKIRFLLTRPMSEDHPGSALLERHGDTPADIALTVADASAAFAEAVRRGARPIAPPARHAGLVTATIAGIADLNHTFVQRDAQAPDALPGRRPVPASAGRRTGGTDTGLQRIDHFAVITEPGRIDEAVAFYRDVLCLELIFVERIEVGPQTMITKVVQSRSRGLTFTLVEPQPAPVPSHLDQFLANHGGAGVQHIALHTSDIIRSVGAMREDGVDFLPAPGSYYDLLAQRLTPHRHGTDELRRSAILVDEDHDGQLYQIFTSSAHPRGTLFFEVIERAGARSFGTGNIKALYSAVEHERDRGPDPR